MVTITSNNDVCYCLVCILGLWPEWIWEARSHVWYSKTEFVLESSCNGSLGVRSCHPITWETVCPDTIGFVILLVIIYHKFLDAITVQVSIGN